MSKRVVGRRSTKADFDVDILQNLDAEFDRYLEWASSLVDGVAGWEAHWQAWLFTGANGTFDVVVRPDAILSGEFTFDYFLGVRFADHAEWRYRANSALRKVLERELSPYSVVEFKNMTAMGSETVDIHLTVEGEFDEDELHPSSEEFVYSVLEIAEGHAGSIIALLENAVDELDGKLIEIY